MAKGDIWFVEERVLGKWWPVLYHDSAPTERSLSGTHRIFRESPKLLKPRHHKFDLEDLVEIYGKRESNGDDTSKDDRDSEA